MFHTIAQPAHAFINAIDFLDQGNEAAAEMYVHQRTKDAALLLSSMAWHAHMPGVMRCEIYGHSILWDVCGDKLRAGRTDARYEMLRKGAHDADCYLHLSQVLAYILATNW
jgi:hypothetical protein